MVQDSDASREAMVREKPRRQAIVLVHGMGEQVPMETVRSFAEAVWKTDQSVQNPDQQNSHELFFVPDANAGSRELRRISTRKSRKRIGAGESYRVRNEFFELYWADSTNDTTWGDFLRWYWRLMLRSPRDVPYAVKWIWVLLWTLNVVFLIAAEIVALWLIDTDIDKIFSNPPHPGWIATLSAAFATDTATDTVRILKWSAYLAAAGAVLALGWLTSRNSVRKFGVWTAAVGGFVLVWCLVVLAGLFAKPMIRALRGHDVFAAGAIALVSAVLVLLQAFLIKFFGDVARMTVPSPGNVLPRQRVRDRGIALIKQLSATERYDRIILVAHSLGCVVAHDIVSLLWSDYAVTRDRSDVPLADSMMTEVKAVEDAAVAKPFDIAAFRKAQRAFFRALQKADQERLAASSAPNDDALKRWLVSDLVTIACPLTHADFLLARNKQDLQDRFSRRELPRCPPGPRPDDNEAMARFPLTYRKESRHGSCFVHDGVFAGVRWTSIHDRPARRLWFLLGDFISGPIADWFGRGIVDVKVEPRWQSAVLPERLFTHTIYWETTQAASDSPPDSVRVIRNAINVLDEDAAEAALIRESAQASNATTSAV